ncbi:MAG: diaminopropionate ammonia-lyase [Holophagales bacterium]|nr:diaminopropionate ammonia-lyase [Holophagales bacterium]
MNATTLATEATLLKNPLARPEHRWPAPDPSVWIFHRRMPAYRATTLYDCPELARRYGVGRVLVKAETQRLGLPSFKILGASWATYRALSDHLGFEPEPWANINDLSRRIGYLRPFSLAAATDGNHGRAVAFMARLLGFGCRIFVPAGTVPARIHAIQNEGAEVTVVDGDYDAAVARSAEEASDKCLVISDTSWPGYDVTPRRVVDGYTTIFMEIEQALAAAGIGAPDVVVVPMGVGAFMSAAVSYYRSRPFKGALVGVEPADANCIQVSAKAGAMTAVPGPHRSIMVGLNCGLPSPVAWPRVSKGVDWMVSIGDERAREAMRGLADAGVVAGETGAAALGALAALHEDGATAEFRDCGLLGPDKTVLLMITEGATDRGNYQAVVGRSPEEIGTILTVAR